MSRVDPVSPVSNKYFELIADSSHRRGWSYGMVSYWNRAGQRMHCVDVIKDGPHLIVHADDILTAFLELEMAIARQERDQRLYRKGHTRKGSSPA